MLNETARMTGNTRSVRQVRRQPRKSLDVVHVIPGRQQLDREGLLSGQGQRIGCDTGRAHGDVSREARDGPSGPEEIVASVDARSYDHVRVPGEALEAGVEVASGKRGAVAVHHCDASVPPLEEVRESVIQSFAEIPPPLQKSFEAGRQLSEVRRLTGRQVGDGRLYISQGAHELDCVLQEALIQIGCLSGCERRGETRLGTPWGRPLGDDDQYAVRARWTSKAHDSRFLSPTRWQPYSGTLPFEPAQETTGPQGRDKPAPCQAYHQAEECASGV